MKPIIVAILIASITTSAAFAFGFGREGTNFGRLGAISNKKAAGGGGATPCSGTGLIFTSACNSQYIGTL